MKAKFILVLMIAVAMLTSCTKEQILKPVKSELIGVWISDDESLQFDIRDTSGAGDYVTYTDIKNGTSRMLKVNLKGNIAMYKIANVTYSEMYLLDSLNTNIHLKKINELP